VINNQSLVVIDEFDGSQLWAWQPKDGAVTGNIVASQNLILVQDQRNTYAIDSQTQQQVWQYPATGHLSLSNEGVLYIAQSEGQLIAISITD
jgi:outer membrane protein assembly factor BamB